MACQRRTICSPKFLTGLLCGIIMGFVMGSIHLAIMNSQFYLSGEENPCLPEEPVAKFRLADMEVDRRNLAAEKFDPDLRRKDMNDDPANEDMFGVNYNYDYNQFSNFEEQQNSDFDRLLDDKDIDKIYEVDISKLGLGGKRERVPHNDQSQNKKVVVQSRRETWDAIKFNPMVERQLEPVENTKLLYVGVMTAAKYVGTRGKAILDTWGRKIPGKVELFVGEDAVFDKLSDDERTLDVVRLKKVDDNAYPPQKKSFMMLKYMYDQYLNGFEWFMRADDDAYVKPEKLEELLRKLNSSEPLFLGQTGLGNEEERGKLTLDHGENYCMGGPGMIFSREVIRRMAPYIGKCLRNMYTNHEDVEVSRCVSKYANVNCVWSYEMRELFYEHYSKRSGYIDPHDGSFGNGLLDAITLHPNKKPEYQRVLHNFFLSQKIKALQTKLSKLYRDVVEADNALDRTPEIEEFMLGTPLTLNRYRPTNSDHILAWHFFTDRSFLSPGEIARRSIPTHTQSAVKDIVLQIMHIMNNNAKARGRVISFQRVNYGYLRVNPLFGSEYVLDLLLHYNRYRGKKVSLAVRRHAYLQHTFGRTELHEDPGTDLVQVIQSESTIFKKPIAGNFIQNHVQAVASFFGLAKSKHHDRSFNSRKKDYNFRVYHNEWESPSNPFRIDSRYSSRVGTRTTIPTVNIIVPLTGRYSTFERFMVNLEKVALVDGNPVSVLIMLFMSKDPIEKLDMRKTQQLIKDYKERYPACDIRFLPVAGEFSRGLALEVGASQFSDDSLLFFCDVDVIFNSEFLRKCRANTVQGKTVYYPVLFSEFDPGFGKSTNGRQVVKDDHFEISRDSGYWRGFGYGLLCVYQSDFVSTGGFDTSIKGWGLEDVDLFGKFVQSETEEDYEKKLSSITAKPMRVHEPDLVHVYHQSHCDPALDSKQLRMCLASRSSGIMSASRLYEKWRKGTVNEMRIERREEGIQNYGGKDKIFYGRDGNAR